jgi:dTDP-glucose 4,6-dehydratase
MKLLVTGSAGFIGSAFVRMLLGKPSSRDKNFEIPLTVERIVSLDLLTYAASTRNLDPIGEDARHIFVKGDIADRALVESLCDQYRPDVIVNFAAESHVDRSIESSQEFLRSNVTGTLTLLDAALKRGIKYLQVSTDEVYGTLGDSGVFTEETPMAPNSPYSASKAAADCFVRSYQHTHKLPVIITRCSNNYGPYQYPEKFLPLSITRLMQGKKIPVYGTGQNVRDWLHVEDHCYGIMLAIAQNKWGEVYNFGGFGETSNIEMAHRLLKLLGREESAIEYVTDRKGHDWRYAMDSSKAQRELGWKPRWSLDAGLKHMVEWFKENRAWWETSH